MLKTILAFSFVLCFLSILSLADAQGVCGQNGQVCSTHPPGPALTPTCKVTTTTIIRIPTTTTILNFPITTTVIRSPTTITIISIPTIKTIFSITTTNTIIRITTTTTIISVPT
ncbi:hypothetical protein BGX34_001590 [Mortierella sp. NVP85]|nr:hypothetical protein BGX34_001590 [Mortierella sp. NVP85]